MLFSSSVFLFIFLVTVTGLYFLLPRRMWRVRNLLLFLVSVAFYWAGERRLVLLMLASVLANWLLGLWAGAARRRGGGVRAAVAVTALVNVGVLFVFKYLSFLSRELSAWIPSLSPVDIALPLGISFYTFQAMSYVFDVARGEVEAEKNPLNVGLYIAFFPQLIAGPIIKYSTFAPQLRERRTTGEGFARGTRRFAVGFCKKVLLANTLGLVVKEAFDAAAPGASFAILGAVCYLLQIYYDFSGYSDMAIGLARVFGFDFPENFIYPYIARGVTEFWRRWHISLSSWFRDYVYIPLGGNRLGKRRQILNLLAVWLLTGIWHGANWTYMVWGLIFFVLLTVEKLTGLDKKLPAWLAHIYTVAAFCLAQVVFRADSLSAAAAYLAAMAGANGLTDPRAGLYLRENWAFLLAGAIFCAPVVQRLQEKLRGTRLEGAADVAAQLALFALTVVSVTYIVKGTYNPFIYSNF